MSTVSRSEEKVRLEDLQHYDPEDISYCSLERPDSPTLRGHHGAMEQEKRIRREIANSNERRRMQSINAGFQSLRTLLPHHEGEKLSKAAILQQTAEYIYTLEQEKTRLLSQNCQLKRLINQAEGEASSAAKKRKTDTGMVVVSDESKAATGSPSTLLDLDQTELIDLRVQLDRERGLRLILEDQVRSLETQLYPERIREITQQVQLQYQHEGEEEGAPSLLEGRPSASPVEAGPETQPPPQAHAPTLTALQVSLQSVSHTETVIATTPSPPPTANAAAAPLAAPVGPAAVAVAVKTEPPSDHEQRLPSPDHPAAAEDAVPPPQARVYLASTSRQNLETIVEAIRHLEGDAFIDSSGAADDPPPTPVPAATAAPTPLAALTKHQRLLNPFLQFHAPPRVATPVVSSQQRPGVIVVKQHT